MLIFYIEYSSSFLRVNCSIHFTKTVNTAYIFVTFPVFWQILSCILIDFCPVFLFYFANFGMGDMRIRPFEFVGKVKLLLVG